MKKILLIHGWDYENYNCFNNENAWRNRKKFIKELKKNYEIDYLNLPGFGGEKEPKSKLWNLDDFAEFINDYINNSDIPPDYILGYSFGGAIALRWKSLYKKRTPIILVSPALLRATNNKIIKVKKWPSRLNFLRNRLRNLYLTYIVKNNEMKYGTNFLRNTYQSIVREDLSKELIKTDPKEIILFFGEKDHMVPPKLLLNQIKGKKIKDRINIIKNGGHDIANTHTKILVNSISEYIDK